VGDDFVYSGSPQGFPTITLNSSASGINQSQPTTPPVASFTNLTPREGIVPLTVTFNDTSTGGPTGWNWDFGDGNFASDNGQQNPSHVFELPGIYTVTLTAMNTGGSSAGSASMTVTVTRQPLLPIPVANFTNVTPREGIAPLTVTFNADASTSTPAQWATWRWTFGDGTFSSVKNATHTYTTGGLYNVSLTATNLGGTNVTTRVGYVNVTAVNRTTKIGVYKDGVWYLDTNGDGAFNTGDSVYSFGLPTWSSVVGNWNGLGKTEVGIYKDGIWYLDTNGDGAFNTGDSVYSFGLPTWSSVVGNWNGLGKTEVGVYKDGIWYLDTNG